VLSLSKYQGKMKLNAFLFMVLPFSLDEKGTKNQVKNKLPPTGLFPRPAFLTDPRSNVSQK
jgi:hypothetical protein